MLRKCASVHCSFGKGGISMKVTATGATCHWCAPSYNTGTPFAEKFKDSKVKLMLAQQFNRMTEVSKQAALGKMSVAQRDFFSSLAQRADRRERLPHQACIFGTNVAKFCTHQHSLLCVFCDSPALVAECNDPIGLQHGAYGSPIENPEKL